MTFVTISVTIRDDQKAWIKHHPEINMSGLLQSELDKRMKETKV